jgi:hypothetical protein
LAFARTAFGHLIIGPREPCDLAIVHRIFLAGMGSDISGDCATYAATVAIGRSIRRTST